jgi:hypothetical protein
MLPIKKIYVDSKYKTRDSISNANFKILLPTTMYMPDNTVFYIDDVAIPHSWHTVEDFNSKLYLNIIVSANGRDQHILELTKQVYNGLTLANEISNKITAIGYDPTVLYNSSTQTISISILDYNFQLLTDDELQTVTWTGATYDTNNLKSANGLIKNTGITSQMYSAENPMIKYIDLQPIRNIYIKSANLGNFNTLGPKGESDIIKKVKVTADFNQMIFDNTFVSNDFLDCSKQTLRTIEFILTDSAGNEVPFHGSPVSFSIIFDIMNKNT